ncbi:MAG: YIP1 family protein [Chloroflexota bacterium]
MDEQSNAPMPSAPSGMAGWFSVWMAAVTKPNEQTFANMANSGDAKATTAYIWVFISSLVSFFFASLVQGAAMKQIMQQYGNGQFGGGGIGTRFVTAICGAPIAAVISVVVFAVVVAIVQFLAKMFGGKGTFDQLAYALAAISTPFALISGVLTLLSAIPFVGLCFSVISIVAGLYVLVLEVIAVKGVNQFGWGQAAGSLLLPFVVLCCCLSVGVFGLMSVLGPKISETFNQINNNLVP